MTERRGQVAQACVTALALCLLPVAVGSAQRITGIVSQDAVRSPVAGAVVSVHDATGGALARTITDTAGRYSLRWPGAASQLRVVHIGHRPSDGHSLSGTPRDTTIDVSLSRLPPMLAAVRVRSDAVCRDTPDRRGALALWEQARAGLLAAVVARQAKPAEMTLLTFARGLDPRSRRVNHIAAKLNKGTSTRPFAAARSAEALARSGFMEGMGGDEIYFAPDADVLLEEAFASTHCFGVQLADAAHPGLLGLSFEPREVAGRSAVVDVRGTLWLDPKGPTLSRLEFRFTGVNPAAARAGSGGTIDFRTMANGVAFISQWMMTLPVLRLGPGRNDPPSLVALSETGGIVTEARWQDGAAWSAGLKQVHGLVTDRVTNKPMAGVVVTIEGLADTAETNDEGYFAFMPLPAGRYSIQATDTVLQHYVRSRAVTREADVSDGAAGVAFSLQPRASLLASVCKDERAVGIVTLLGRVLIDEGDLPSGLSVESLHQEDYSVTSDNKLMINERRQQIDVDKDGRFLVCGVARERPAQLRLRLGRQVVADTVVKSTAIEALRNVEWSLQREVLAAARRGLGGSVSGTVRDAATGAPLGGVEVWVPLLDVRASTDSAGQFQVSGLPSGHHIVQVRRIGYAMQLDTMTMVAGGVARRAYQMVGQGSTLDTVRSVAARVPYISPGLRGFEERRSKGHGQFIAEETLRKGDNTSLPNVLIRVPGIQIIASRTGAFVGTRRSGSSGGAAGAMMGAGRNLPCYAAVYLDGQVLYSGPPDTPPDLGRMLTRDFAAVEFYSGGAVLPVQFSAVRASDCGVLLLWSRER